MSKPCPVILFTDLDGTLLDHDNYSFAAARPALARIRALRIPLVIVTSKTKAEVLRLRQEMGLAGPFIVENGGALLFPIGYRDFRFPTGVEKGGFHVISFGTAHNTITDFIVSHPELGINGLSTMPLADATRLTDLTGEALEAARQRQYSEPFILQDKQLLPRVETLAADAGLTVTRGGRFFHLMGAAQDKGRAVRVALEIFTTNGGSEKHTSWGLGDSRNDFPMLAVVDRPVLVPQADGFLEPLELPGLINAPCPGSRGWSKVVEDILEACE